MAGQLGQGEYSVAIGNNAGTSNQEPYTIILNACTDPLNSTRGATGTYIKPIRVAPDGTVPPNTTHILTWDSDSGELVAYPAPGLFQPTIQT